jgi:hypothetical protein
MTIEVDPDEGSGDAALVARAGAHIGAAQGVDRGLLAGDGIADPVCLWWNGTLSTYLSSNSIRAPGFA